MDDLPDQLIPPRDIVVIRLPVRLLTTIGGSKPSHQQGTVFSRSAPEERSAHFVLSATCLRSKGARRLRYVGGLH